MISACMAVSVRELRTAVREWACCVPRVRTTKYGKSSFCYEAAGVWNSLPNDLRKVEDFKEFKRLVNTWSGSSCKCSMCKS